MKPCPNSAVQNVRNGSGHLASNGIQGLAGEIGEAFDKRLVGSWLVLDDVGDEVTLISVSFAQMRNQPAGRRRRLCVVSCAAQQLLLGSRAPSLDSMDSGHCIDRLLGLVPRSREFAPDDGHE